MTGVVVAGSLFVAALWTFGPYVFRPKNDPNAIDNPVVRRTLLASCHQLRADLATLPAGLAPTERAEAENRAVEAMVARVRALGPERLGEVPAPQYLDDWDAIVAARRSAMAAGRPLALPVHDGRPVNMRMFALIEDGMSDCDVPVQLLAPHPGQPPPPR